MPGFATYPFTTNPPNDATLLTSIDGQVHQIKFVDLVSAVLALIGNIGAMAVRNDITSLTGLEDTSLQNLDTTPIELGTVILVTIADKGSVWVLRDGAASELDDVIPVGDAALHWRRIMGL
jgi:hypothetical protein